MGFEFMLAPLEDITGSAMRNVCHKYGADLTFTPLARVDGLARKNSSTWSRLDFKDDTPVMIQLIGAREMNFSKFLSMFEPGKGFKGFNLNLGCPSPNVVSNGQGCAMIKRISKVRKILNVIKNYGYKASIKTRLGLNEYEKQKKAYLNLINSADAEFFIVHARHGAQTYDQPADFSIYEECVKTGKKIVANGDITTAEQAEFLKGVGVKGAMIGRQAVIDPGIFNRLKGIAAPPKEKIIEECCALSEKYEEPFKYRKNLIKHSGYGREHG